MAQHTPGPWFVEPNDTEGGYLIQVEDQLNVASTYSFSAPDREGQEAANAVLIAAAPFMLTTLKEALLNAEYRLSIAPIYLPRNGGLDRGSAQAEVDALRSAIAAATVEPGQ